jgi:hypothetical protein
MGSSFERIQSIFLQKPHSSIFSFVLVRIAQSDTKWHSASKNALIPALFFQKGVFFSCYSTLKGALK